MVKMGFFAGLFGTMFEFYGGMFRLTFFLPFTLLQAWQLSRSKYIENIGAGDKLDTTDEDCVFQERETEKLERKRRKTQDDSTLLSRRKSLNTSQQERSRSLDSELEKRSTSSQNSRKLYQEKSKNQSLLDGIPDESQETILESVDDKSTDGENYPPVKPTKPVAVSSLSVGQMKINSKTELHDKLNLNKSVDKPSSRYLHGGSGRRRNKQKILRLVESFETGKMQTSSDVDLDITTQPKYSVKEMARYFQDKTKVPEYNRKEEVTGKERKQRSERKRIPEEIPKLTQKKDKSKSTANVIEQVKAAEVFPPPPPALLQDTSKDYMDMSVVSADQNDFTEPVNIDEEKLNVSDGSSITTNEEKTSHTTVAAIEQPEKIDEKVNYQVKETGENKKEVSEEEVIKEFDEVISAFSPGLVEENKEVYSPSTDVDKSPFSKQSIEIKKIYAGCKDLKSQDIVSINLDPMKMTLDYPLLTSSVENIDFTQQNLKSRMSVSTSQLSIELNDDVEDNEDKNDSSKKKTKKRKMFQSASQLFSRFKQEKILKDFWTTTKQEEEFLRTRGSDTD